MAIQSPYGDIFFVNTPNMDRAQQQLHQENLQRQAIGYRDYQAQQQMLQKEFANVRSADIPDLMKNYGDYKQVRQQILFNRKLQHDPIAYAQAQQLANQKLSDIYGLINSSKETKEFDEGISKDMVAHRDEYDNSAGQTHMGWMQMPTKDRIAQGFVSPEPLLYKGTNTDMSSIEKAAIGESKEYQGTTELTPDKMQFIDRNYVRGNNPLQYAATFSDALNKKQAGQDAAILYKQIPPEQKTAIEQAVQNATDDDLKKWGMTRDQLAQLSQANAPSDAGKYAIYKAQKYFLENQPQLGKPTYRNNEGALLANKQAFDKMMEGIRQGNRLGILAAKQKYKDLNKSQQDGWLNDFIANDEKFAQQNPRVYKYANGTEETQFSSGNPIAKQAFKSDDIRYLKNGNVLLLFYKYNKDADGNWQVVRGANGKAAVDTDRTQQISREQYKAGLGKVLLSKKDLGNEMNDDEENETTPDNESSESVPSFLRK